MLRSHKRLRNRLLQFFYKPNKRKSRFVSDSAWEFLDELDKKVEEKITPFLASLFD